jgi:hypothetical protein
LIDDDIAFAPKRKGRAHRSRPIMSIENCQGTFVGDRTLFCPLASSHSINTY